MMNYIWAGMLMISLIMGLLNGTSAQVLDAMLTGAANAVTLCISLGGAFLLWMGLINVAKEAGLIDALGRKLRPLLSRLFPDCPGAVTPVTLNLAANFFGMGSAATPFGLEAVKQMQKTNPNKTVATDGMCMFVALNASAVELLPTGVIALRTAAGSADPYAVVIPTFLASLASAAVALACCLALRRGRVK